MRKTTCILRFSDGQSVSASVAAETPQESPQVFYSGDLQRLLRTRQNTDGPVLKAMFGNLAKEMNATLEVIEEGNYDAWAL